MLFSESMVVSPITELPSESHGNSRSFGLPRHRGRIWDDASDASGRIGDRLTRLA